jgi:ABC-2 type transport system ATP-binding protein
MTQPRLDIAIASWLERMGLADRIDAKIDTLSKGMSQKVQFVATVVAEPELVILDEPFSGLDPVNREVLKDAVLDLKRAGATVVFSTHDMAVAESLCDRIFMIYKGRKVLDGTLDDIQSQYGFDTLRVRTEEGPGVFAGLDRVEDLNDLGNYQELRWRGEPQELLRTLIGRATITHFEITRPSLHDIFVRIAAPEAEAVAHG